MMGVVGVVFIAIFFLVVMLVPAIKYKAQCFLDRRHMS